MERQIMDGSSSSLCISPFAGTTISASDLVGVTSAQFHIGNEISADYGTPNELHLSDGTVLRIEAVEECECTERENTMSLWKVYYLERNGTRMGETLVLAKNNEAAKFQVLLKLGATDYDAFQMTTEYIMEKEEDE